MHQQSNIFEGLEQGDLKRLVVPELHIDEFKSKMGTDADIIVLSLEVKEKEPAAALMQFFETGYKFVLDSDVSAGVMDNGNYMLFVELERSIDAPDQIMELVDSMLNLTDQDIADWNFQYRKNSKQHDLTTDNLANIIPLTPEFYTKQYKDADDEITAMQEAARVPINKTAPVNSWTEQLRVAAGLK